MAKQYKQNAKSELVGSLAQSGLGMQIVKRILAQSPLALQPALDDDLHGIGSPRTNQI